MYRSQATKHIHIELDKNTSFGEFDYFKQNKERTLMAKAASKVVCFTLSYEICEKFFPKMIEKEVRDLGERAERIEERIQEKLDKKEQTYENGYGQRDGFGEDKPDILMDSDEDNRSNGFSPKIGGKSKREKMMELKMASGGIINSNNNISAENSRVNQSSFKDERKGSQISSAIKKLK